VVLLDGTDLASARVDAGAPHRRAHPLRPDVGVEQHEPHAGIADDRGVGSPRERVIVVVRRCLGDGHRVGVST
jgi:hypothetical protein